MGCLISKQTKNIGNTNITDKNLKIINKPGIKILYLEDAEIHYDLLNFLFHNYVSKNIEIIWKKTIDSAFNYLQNNQVNLVFIDRLLENEMGDDLIYKLKETGIYDLKKIIIISSINKPEDIQKFIDMGIFYIKKPIDTNEFIKTMKNVFN